MTLQNNIWRVMGEMQISTVAELEKQGREMIDKASGELTLDLGGVSKSDSTGVALLIAWLRYARNKQKKIRFQNLPLKMLDNVKVSGLEEVLAV